MNDPAPEALPAGPAALPAGEPRVGTGAPTEAQRRGGGAWRDWGGAHGGPGLPPEVLALVAEKVAAQSVADWVACRQDEERLPGAIAGKASARRYTAERRRRGTCLFPFAMVCRAWRAAQRRVGGPLRTQVWSDVLLPGRAALLAWALAEGCPARGPPRSFCEWPPAPWSGQEPPGGAGVDLFGAAASLGHLELLRWLRRERGGAPGWDAWGACLGGDTAWLLMVFAAERGDLALARWVCAERGSVADWAARAFFPGAPPGGHRAWGGAGAPGDNPRLLDCAAACGHLGLVRYLCEAHGDAFALDATMMRRAALSGDLPLVRWLWVEGGACDAEACAAAAWGGHLDVLRWLRAVGCDWNLLTCDLAVKRGHVQVLRWARGHGCEWAPETRDGARRPPLGYTDDLGNVAARGALSRFWDRGRMRAEGRTWWQTSDYV